MAFFGPAEMNVRIHKMSQRNWRGCIEDFVSSVTNIVQTSMNCILDNPFRSYSAVPSIGVEPDPDRAFGTNKWGFAHQIAYDGVARRVLPPGRRSKVKFKIVFGSNVCGEHGVSCIN